MRWARPRLQGPSAIAGTVLLVACSGTADAVPPPASASSAPAAPPASVAASMPATPAATLAAGAAAAQDGAAAGGDAGARQAADAREAACEGVPLAIRVASVRRESADSVRIELALTNRTPADAWTPGSPAVTAARAAVGALDGASVLSADGRRRMFALRDAAGELVGPVATVPAVGRTEAFWRLFPAAEGRVTLLLPGCAPLDGLAVSPGAARPEP